MVIWFQKPAKTKCNEVYDMDESRIVTFSIGIEDCNWDFIGSFGCKVEIRCSKISLESCDSEYLIISDGIGGEEKICGEATFNNWKHATGYAKDVYMEYHGKGSKTSRECQARCGEDGEPLKLSTSMRKENSRCICGLKPTVGQRIVGGETAGEFEFPWQVAIVENGTRKSICGGTLINDRYILTASHCFFRPSINLDDIEVLVHAYQLNTNLLAGWKDVKLGLKGSIRGPGYQLPNKNDADEGTQRYKVQEIITHPLYTNLYDYDVALLRLDRKVDLIENPEVNPICLPEIGVTEIHYNTEATITGWGKPDEYAGATVKLLQKLSVPILDRKTCSKTINEHLTQRMLCAGYVEGKKDACQGDSGGPLFLTPPKKGGQHHQIGITSWGIGCARKNNPGIYSNLQVLVQWVYQHAKGAVWCRTVNELN